MSCPLVTDVLLEVGALEGLVAAGACLDELGALVLNMH